MSGRRSGWARGRRRSSGWGATDGPAARATISRSSATRAQGGSGAAVDRPRLLEVAAVLLVGAAVGAHARNRGLGTGHARVVVLGRVAVAGKPVSARIAARDRHRRHARLHVAAVELRRVALH